MTAEQKTKAYDEAIKIAKETYKTQPIYRNWLESMFPELAESEDERVRKAILTGLIDCRDAPDLGWSNFGGIPIDDCIAWLEKQRQVKEPIISQHENSLTSDDERVRKLCEVLVRTCFMNELCTKEDNDDCMAWLEKQGEQKPQKASIWKHWKDGIAGNGEGELIYLIKYGDTYNLSSWLCFECDYILLSDLDKLMLSEKQGEQEEPQVYKTEDGEIITYSENDGYKVVKPKFNEDDWITIKE